MTIKEINVNEFDSFANKHVLGSFYQTSNYGKLKEKEGYKALYIGAYDNSNLFGAFLLLSKSISLNVKYGYSPRGFLIDYFNKDIFKDFTDSIKKYFHKKGYAFIKIDPIIILNEVDKNGNKSLNNSTNELIITMEELGYKKLKDNIYFESMLPKYNPIVNLKTFSFNNLDAKLQKSINKISSKGLSLIKGDFYNINSLYELTKRKEDKESNYYKSMYKIFDENNLIDLFLVEVDYHEYLLNLQDDHETEATINEKINKIFQMDPTNKNIYNEKMLSDRKLYEINEEIAEVSKKIQNSIFKEYVAGALVVKHNNVASIYISGFDKFYNRLLPNHYLHYSIINYYKNEGLSFLDLNGITGDFTKNNPYKGLNDFKLSWNPKVYEYIGEFDLIINQTKYSLLWSSNKLQKEFEKKGLKSN